MINFINEVLLYMYMWYVFEFGDFLGELGDSVLFGGEEVIVKFKFEIIKINIFSLEKMIGLWNEIIVFFFKICIKIYVIELDLS